MHIHHDHDDHHHHSHHEGHTHSHGLVDESILRSHAGVRAVSISLCVLFATAAAQIAIYSATISVSLLADIIHNVGDALTALPLAVAFLLRSKKLEKQAGYFVVFIIFVSAVVALYQAVDRFINPQIVTNLWMLAGAGVIGFVGNEIAALIRLRAGKRLQSPALIADGHHARVDGLVSLSVVASAALVATGWQIADPLIGLVITLVILRITWHSYQTMQEHH
jgi:cation diffusion facilitator family transporter